MLYSIGLFAIGLGIGMILIEMQNQGFSVSQGFFWRNWMAVSVGAAGFVLMALSLFV